MCSPPSKMLADLEQKWGMTLLERSKAASALTSRWGAGQAVFAAGAQRKAEVSGLLARSCAVGHPLHRLGGFCHHGDGGKESRRQHPARPDLAAHPHKNRNPLLQQPYYHPIGLAMKKQAHPTPAVQKFIEYFHRRKYRSRLQQRRWRSKAGKITVSVF